MVFTRLSPKKESIDVYTSSEPSCRVPNRAFYQSVVGPDKAKNVVYKMPMDGRPFYKPIGRKLNVDSKWNKSLWPASLWLIESQLNKRKSQERFLLSDNEMADLAYIIGPKDGKYQDHLYLAVEVERRAWGVYGGPERFQNARKVYDDKIRRKRNEVARERRQARVQNASPVKASGSSRSTKANQKTKKPANFADKNITKANRNLRSPSGLEDHSWAEGQGGHGFSDSDEHVEDVDEEHSPPPPSPLMSIAGTPSPRSSPSKSSPRKASQKTPSKSAGPSSPSVVRTPHTPSRSKADLYLQTPTRSNARQTQNQRFSPLLAKLDSLKLSTSTTTKTGNLRHLVHV